MVILVYMFPKLFIICEYCFLNDRVGNVGFNYLFQVLLCKNMTFYRLVYNLAGIS